MFQKLEIEHSTESGAPCGAAWDRFVRLNGPAVTRCVRRAMLRAGWVPRGDEVAELVQEVYCRLLERRDPAAVIGRPAAQLACFLRAIARSVVVDELRTRQARKRGGGLRAVPSSDDGPGLDDRPAPGPSAEERLLARERAGEVRRRVRAAFPGALGERNLRVLELAAVVGMTAPEIARQLHGEITPSSVHTVLHRLRQMFAVDAAAADGQHSV
jgi:RNA polymerase sigma factor (sigma-70 family)